jgi:hypothetical protein
MRRAPVDPEWQETFRARMNRFESRHPRDGYMAVSVKARVSSGCFHREHSPRAYEIIDEVLGKTHSDGSFSFEEHESGPEILIYVAATTAVVTLANSVINLVTAIIKARSEGIKKGDHPSEPLSLIVRRFDEGTGVKEEIVLRIESTDAVQKKQIADALTKAVKKLLVERKR